MRGKLVPCSTNITRMLCSQTLCFKTLYKSSQFYLSNCKQVSCRSNSYPRFEIYTSKKFDLARCAGSIATHVKENVYSELEKLMDNGLLRRKDVDKALVNKSSYEDLDKSLLVLKCINKVPDISPKNRVALSEEFFSKVKSASGVVEAHCLQVLKCYLKSRYFENLDSFLQMMKNYGVDHSKDIQLLVLKCLSIKGMEKESFALMKELEKSNLNTQELHAAKIYSLAVSGFINDAFDEIKQMKEKNFQIGSEIYTSLLKAIALKGDKIGFESLVEDVLVEGIIFSVNEICDILECAVLSKNYDLILNVRFLCSTEVLLKASQILLVEIVYSDNVESAYAFMNYLFGVIDFICESHDQDVFLSSMTKSFIEELFNINYSLDDLIEKCKELKKMNKNLYCLEYALYYYLKKKDIRGSLIMLQLIFKEDLPIEAHYFWPLFMIAKEKFGDEGIIFVMKKMAELNVLITPETLIDYVFPNGSDSRIAKHILDRVNLIEAQHELFIEVFLLYTVKKGLFKECLQFLKEYPTIKNKSYSYLKHDLMEALLKNPYNEDIVAVGKETNALDPFKVISKLWSQKKKKEINQLIQYFKKYCMYAQSVKEAKAYIGLHQNQPFIKEAVSVLIRDGTGSESDENSSETLRRSRFEEFVDLEEGEIVLAELKAKKWRITGQLLRLIKMYMWMHLYDKAIKTKNEALQILGKNLDFSPGYLIMLARLSAHEGDMTYAVSLMKSLKEKYPLFNLSCFNGLSLCHSFIQHKHYEDMLNILQALPNWEGSANQSQAKAVKVLREVAQLGMPELTDVIFKIMQKKGYVLDDANTLQAYIKTYIYANDLDGAVKEYMRITEKTGVLSNVTQMLYKLKDADRFDLIDTVLNFNMNKKTNLVHLIAALIIIADKGDPNIVLSYSEELKIPLDHEALIKKCSAGKIPHASNAAFETLIKASIIRKLRYTHFIDALIIIIGSENNYKRATEFLDFCKSNNLIVRNSQLEKLELLSELGQLDPGLSSKDDKEMQDQTFED